jgi:ribonuclease-3
MEKDLGQLQKDIGVQFKDNYLIKTATTHRSYLNEHRDEKEHNERLEFLGDAVLELVVTEYLYENFNKPEGELTNYRASLVRGAKLAEISEKFNLLNYLRMSKGEAKGTARSRQYIVANAVEALIGAIYLDQGFKQAKEFIAKFIISELPKVLKEKEYIDAKSDFQEKAQAIKKITPTYEVLEEKGPDHEKWFKIAVQLNEKIYGIGTGSSKQDAEQSAAADALEKQGW